jgi:adenine-specific DNA-methyltransferase
MINARAGQGVLADFRPDVGEWSTTQPLTANQIEALELHRRCGVFTNSAVVNDILDLADWTAAADLSRATLLEPACGDGAFLVHVAERLVGSLKRRGLAIDRATLSPRVQAFEIVEAVALVARVRVTAALQNAGVAATIASEVAADWIKAGDFLLEPALQSSVTHVVGNPPYIRWSKLPPGLRKAYETALSAAVARGDLFLPFLDRGIEALVPQGRLAFVCSDRWKHMAFAEGFRRTRLRDVDVILDRPIEADAAFLRDVDVYPSVIVFQKRFAPASSGAAARRQGSTLAELGFSVRVGPALGCTPAFVVEPDEPEPPEDELLAPFVAASDIQQDGSIRSSGKKVVCLHDDSGRLRDIADYPRAIAFMERHRTRLEGRSICVRHGAPWFRPIDRVSAAVWRAPKLLIPELSRVPRVALDKSGSVPAHGVYAVIGNQNCIDIEDVHCVLNNGGLEEMSRGQTSLIKGGYRRCYKKFLLTLTLPFGGSYMKPQPF